MSAEPRLPADPVERTFSFCACSATQFIKLQALLKLLNRSVLLSTSLCRRSSDLDHPEASSFSRRGREEGESTAAALLAIESRNENKRPWSTSAGLDDRAFPALHATMNAGWAPEDLYGSDDDEELEYNEVCTSFGPL